MGTRSISIAAMLAGTAFVAAAPHAAQAQDFPSKSVSFIVPYAAGGSLDTMARVIGPAWSNGSASRS